MTFDLVIFDCDGVLIDSEHLAVRADVVCLAEIGIELGADEILARYTGISVAEMLRDIASRHGCILPDDILDRHQRRVREIFEAELQAIPGIAAVLDALPCRACVASGSSPQRLRHALSLVGLYNRFAPHLFSATMVARGKPAPDLFLYAAHRMGVVPARCLVVEDSPAGIEAAHAAGMAAIGFAGGSHCRPGHGERLRQRGAALVIAEMADFAAAMTRLSPPGEGRGG